MFKHFLPALLSCGIVAMAALPARAQSGTRFPFLMPWDDASPGVIDCSNLNPAPLTERQRLVARNGHFFDGTGRRVRIIGTNIVASANFSDPADIARVAARLHKFGFNCVRLHHMDASWSNPNIFGANRDNAHESSAQVSPDSLRLLDNAIAQYKQHGIYVDLNLHVARGLSPGDGFPDTDKVPGMGKVVAYFEPHFIQMQKEYARQLLDHVNPLTGLRLADDPVLAFIELNNEDTLVGEAWNGSLQALPPHYRDILQSGWNRFLKDRYPTTAALRTAWGAEAAPGGMEGGATDANLLLNPQFAHGPANWQLETQGDAHGELAVEDIPAGAGPEGRALRVRVQQLPDQDWKLQLHQTGLNLQDGLTYTLSFWARAETARSAGLYFALDQAPWSQVGGSGRLVLTPEWKPFRFVFLVQGTQPNHGRLSISVGDAMGDVLLAGFKLQTGAVAEIPASQTLEAGSMDLPPAHAMTPGQGRDWLGYLASVEHDYAEGMRRFLKDELKTRALVTCSQASYGGFAGVAREAGMDYVDMHAYWQHPSFPNRPWDSQDWNITNTAMADDPDGGTLLGLAAHRVQGMPFTVSEYNQPAPGDYAAETVPMAFAYAAAQDWDGLYLFDYNGNRDQWNPGKIRGFFDIDSDPNKMAWLPWAARTFLTGAIPPFPTSTVLMVPRNTLMNLATNSAASGFWNNVPGEWKARGLTRPDLLRSRLELQLIDGSGPPRLQRSGARFDQGTTPPLQWEFVGRDGTLCVDESGAKALIGHWATAWNGPQVLGDLRVEHAQSSNGWAVLGLTTRDAQTVQASSSLLLTVMNRAENENMGWNADRTSVADQWGSGPPQVEVPEAQISLRTGATSAQVFALDATGQRAHPVASELAGGYLRFEVGPRDSAVWYEIACVQPPTPASNVRRTR